MKTLLTILILFAATAAPFAQGTFNKTIPVTPGQKLRMRLDYPKARIMTWDKNEIQVNGDVNINGGENNDAFKLNIDTDNSTITITSEMKDLENLPRRITVTTDGQKMVFKNESEWRKYQDEHGSSHRSYSNGVDIDIELTIRIPKNMETRIEAVYGLVEIKEFTGPLTVSATYGGVDATLVERSVGELVAETNYGHIYSNLDLKMDTGKSREEDFHTVISAKIGDGPRYSFESTYGNVYLRKTN